MDIGKTEITDQINELLTKLRNAGFAIREAYLFGSSLKSEDYNDVDLALVSDQFSGIRFFDLKSILDSVNNYSPDIDLHPFRTTDFYDEDNFFAQEIIEHGKQIIIN